MSEKEKQNTKEQERKIEVNILDSSRITEEDDKENWNWLPSEERAKRIEQVRHAVKKLWKSFEDRYPQLPYYTPHGPTHAQSVEDLMHRLLPGKNYKKLKEIERFYLLAAAWTHDVGMIRGLFNEKEVEKLHPDQIRAEHHKRSEQYIVNHYSMLDIEENDAQALGLLAFFHRKQEDLEKCPELFAVGTETVRLRLLAAYLRLADALDVGQSRAPSAGYAICLAYNIPFTSKLHWIKSRLVSGIAVIPEKKRIEVHFKQPHEEDILKIASDKRLVEKDLERKILVERNFERLRQIVMNGLREELDSVKTALIRGEITSYLDIIPCSTEMRIDDQVLKEISGLVIDFDMMIHPSVTKLILLLLSTIEQIIERHLNPFGKEGGCNAEKCNSKYCKDNDGKCQIPKMVKDEINKFLADIQELVIKKRKSHIGLERLLDSISKQIKKEEELDKINEFVLEQKKKTENTQLEVRVNAYKYFHIPFAEKEGVKKEKVQESIERELNNKLKELANEKKTKKELAEEEGERKKEDEKKPANSVDEHKYFIDILLYGYSGLVVEAISGFRDVVKGIVVSEIGKMMTGKENSSVSIVNYLHRINIEEIASSIFRIFICEGQPETVTGSNDILQYHDGTRFAFAISRRGFKNVVLIPDVVVGSLLERNNAEPVDQTKSNKPKINYVLIGTDGLWMHEHDTSKKNDVFLNSSGHMAIAKLAGCKTESDCAPRLVLVLSMSKCAICKEAPSKEAPSKEAPSKEAPSKEAPSKEESQFELKDGYLFSKGYGEKTTKEVFFTRDKKVRDELYEHKIALLNPKEDKVPLAMVNDVIFDKDFIEDVKENKDKLFNFIKKEYGDQEKEIKLIRLRHKCPDCESDKQ